MEQNPTNAPQAPGPIEAQCSTFETILRMRDQIRLANHTRKEWRRITGTSPSQ